MYLFFWEELSALLARGRWSGATVLEFLTETFDCPPEWGLKYKKSPVSILKPTPSILAGTTPEWFWKNARDEDFYGGFGNRFLYLTGRKKAPLPDPKEPDAVRLRAVKTKLTALGKLEGVKASWDSRSKRLWEEFYRDWESRERSGLLSAALKRVHVYVRKLAMTYAACEETLPEITLDQLQAAIGVGVYSAECTEALIDARNQNTRPESELERRFIAWVEKHPGTRVRHMQQTVSKYCGSAEVFNRVLRNLAQADQLQIRGNPRRVYREV